MKKTKICSIVLVCLLVIISVAGIVVHINNKRNFKGGSQESYMATVVMKGFEFKIPDKYMATYDENMGLMYWNIDHFDMMIDVEEGDYKADVSDKLDEINKLMLDELVVVKPYSQITIDGKSYTYLLYYNEGIPTIHCYTQADDNNLFSIMILCNEMAMIKPQSEKEIMVECEKLLSIADSITSTAKPTDKENSPSGEVFVGEEAYELLYSDVELNLSDKYIAKDYVQGISTKTKVNFGVKENYYCTGSKSKDDIYYLKLYGDYNGNLITVHLHEKDNYDIKSVMEEGCDKWTDGKSTVYEYNINERKVYYYTYETEVVEDNEIVTEYNYISITDLGDGYVYLIEGNGISNDMINPDYYKNFYDVNLEKNQ